MRPRPDVSHSELSEPAVSEPAVSEPGVSRTGTARRRRSRAVLYASLVVAALLAVLITLLASSKPVADSVASSPLLGKSAPQVSGRALNGKGAFSLSSFRGRWVLLNFSASWCIPCRNETPQLLTFQSEHALSGDATVFAVEFDPSDSANLAAFLASNHAPWPAINDPSAEVSYGVTGIPESYLIDPAGTVVAKFFGGVTSTQVDKSISQASS